MSFLANSPVPRFVVRGTLIVALVAGLVSLAGTASAQEKIIKKEPIAQTDASSGKAMYASYCAACHGPAGKGNGPAASQFKVAPTDLTQLAKNNHGEFPKDHVWAILQFGAKAPAHGTSDMPVWGGLLHALEPNDPVRKEQRIANLVSYVNSLQVK